jgi:hypothetical protein
MDAIKDSVIERNGGLTTGHQTRIHIPANLGRAKTRERPVSNACVVPDTDMSSGTPSCRIRLPTSTFKSAEYRLAKSVTLLGD